MKLLKVSMSLVVAAIWPRKETVRLRAEFSAAEPTELARAKLLPQLSAFQGCAPVAIPKVSRPVSASSAATEVRNKMLVAPQRNSPVKAVVVPVWR